MEILTWRRYLAFSIFFVVVLGFCCCFLICLFVFFSLSPLCTRGLHSYTRAVQGVI